MAEAEKFVLLNAAGETAPGASSMIELAFELLVAVSPASQLSHNCAALVETRMTRRPEPVAAECIANHPAAAFQSVATPPEWVSEHGHGHHTIRGWIDDFRELVDAHAWNVRTKIRRERSLEFELADHAHALPWTGIRPLRRGGLCAVHGPTLVNDEGHAPCGACPSSRVVGVSPRRCRGSAGGGTCRRMRARTRPRGRGTATRRRR